LEEILATYRRLLEQLEEEVVQISLCFQGDILEKYLKVLESERNKLLDNIHYINQNLL